MSHSKALALRLPSLSLDQLDMLQAALARQHSEERNPMIRSSLSCRLRMVRAELVARSAWHLLPLGVAVPIERYPGGV